MEKEEDITMKKTQKMKVEFADGSDEKAVMENVVKACKRVEDDCEIYL